MQKAARAAAHRPAVRKWIFRRAQSRHSPRQRHTRTLIRNARRRSERRVGTIKEFEERAKGRPRTNSGGRPTTVYPRNGTAAIRKCNNAHAKTLGSWNGGRWSALYLEHELLYYARAWCEKKAQWGIEAERERERGRMPNISPLIGTNAWLNRGTQTTSFYS